MSRWFRHYAGMMRDDKLVRASLKSKQSIERVVWIYGAVLESAAEIDDDGRYEIDVAEIVYFLRCRATAVEAVLAALKDLGRIDDERVTAWSKRQFKSDRSNDRVAAHRASRKRPGNVTGNVTPALPQRDSNAPETETETYSSVAKATGPKPDSDQVFWEGAKTFLAAETKNPGALVGKWCRDHTKVLTAEIITRAQLERPAQRIPFIEGCFRAKSREREYDQPLV